MPTLYMESTQSGTVKTWRAAKLVQAFNTHGEVPRLEFYEVERSSLNGVLVKETPTGRVISVTMSNPTGRIPHINPETYEQILGPGGSVIENQSFTQEFVEYVLACVYINEALALDSQE